MKSVASLMSNSTIPNNDIADLDTLLEDDETVSVPTNELAALTQSIRSMNEKLETLNPSVLPVRTLLQADAPSRSVPAKDPDPPPNHLSSAAPSTSYSPKYSPKAPTPPPRPLATMSKNTFTVESNDDDSEPLLGGQTTAKDDPKPVIQPRIHPVKQESISPPDVSTPTKKVPATPPRRRHSRNTSISSPFFLPPTPQQQPPPLPARPTPQKVLPTIAADNFTMSDLATRLENIADTSAEEDNSISSASKLSKDLDQDITKSLEASLILDKSNGTVTETVAVTEELTSANQSVISQISSSVIIDDDKVNICSDNNKENDPSTNEQDVEIRIVDSAKKTEKLHKSKSQELREFTQEFVLSTVVDFDPMTFENTPKSKNNTLKRTTLPKQPQTTAVSSDFKQDNIKSTSIKSNVDIVTSKQQNIHSEEPKFKPVRLEFEDTPAMRRSASPATASSSSRGKSPSPLAPPSHVPGDASSRSKSPSPTASNGQPGSNSHKLISDRRGLVSSETSPNLSYIAADNVGVSSGKIAVDEVALTPVTAVPPPKVGGTGIGASSDLLDWAKTNLANYSTVKVTNFTTSWRNGLAFCALIHNFYPDLVQFQDLNSHDIKLNNKIAFEAGEILGIPRVLEPENMAIRKIPDKLAVITYLHQLRSSLGTEETNAIYEAFKTTGQGPSSGMAIRKSFSEGNIKLFAKQSTFDAEKGQLELPTVQEEDSNSPSTNGSESPSTTNNNVSKYRQKAGAKNLMESAKLEASPEKLTESLDTSITSTKTVSSSGSTSVVSSVSVVRRQKSMTPKSKGNSSLKKKDIQSFATVVRETSEDDQLVYDALLQQWFTLVNKKNTLIRRQMQLNILEREDDLEKKYILLQEELRMLSDMAESKKSDEDKQREELLLQELVMVVNQRNELVMQGEYEEQMIHHDEQIEQDVTIPDDRLVHNRARDDCKMQ